MKKIKLTKREALVGGLSLTITIALCIFIIQHRYYLEEISHWGYLGCFIINLLASGTLVMPGFGIPFTFTLGGVLHPAIVGAIAGMGETLGSLGAYFTGYGGRGLLRDTNNSLYIRFSNLLHRHGSKGIFFMAAIINPFYYPFAVLVGMMRFGWIRFFLATWVGRTIKNMVLAYLGYFGLRSILQWFGLSF
ncbi:MAG: VTT domain-containing protein [Chloroflexota bacterium]|nr:VTT domain-containing protein [Chloroflexota bacterium]